MAIDETKTTIHMKHAFLSISFFCFAISAAFAQSPCQISLTSAYGTDAQTVCANTAITPITYSFSATSASVNGLPNGITGNYSGNVFTISGTSTTSGTYRYYVTTTGCSTQDTTFNGSIKASSLHTSPTATMSLTGNTNVCRDSVSPRIVFIGNSGTSPYQFTFKINNDTAGIGYYGDSVLITDNYKTGTFTYKLLSVKDANGCQQAQSDSVKIVVYRNPQTIFTVNKELITSQNKLQITLKNLSIIDSSVSNSYKWDFGDGHIKTTSVFDSTVQYTYADTGVYNIKFVLSNIIGCSDSTYETVKPCFVHFTHVTDSVQKTVTITVDSATAAFAKTYSWNFNWASLNKLRSYDPNHPNYDIDSVVFVDDANSSTLPNPTINFPKDTVYPAILRITTAHGRNCTTSSGFGKDSYWGWRTAGFKLIVNNPYARATAIETAMANEEAIVFPNPTSGHIILNVPQGEGTVTICNVVGEKLYEFVISTTKPEIDLSTQPNGVYFISIQTNEGTVNEKIVVSR